MDRYTCKICGSEFESDKSAKYCPPPKDCRKVAKRLQNEKARRKKGIPKKVKGMKRKPAKFPKVKCWCGKIFRKRSPGHKHCSVKCGDLARAEALSKGEAVKPANGISPDDFSQLKFRREQREMQKPNGRYCEKCGEALRGPYRQVCPECKRLRDRVCDTYRCDGDWGWETVIDQMRW